MLSSRSHVLERHLNLDFLEDREGVQYFGVHGSMIVVNSFKVTLLCRLECCPLIVFIYEVGLV